MVAVVECVHISISGGETCCENGESKELQDKTCCKDRKKHDGDQWLTFSYSQ